VKTLTLRRGLYLFVAWVLGGTSEANTVKGPRSFFVVNNDFLEINPILIYKFTSNKLHNEKSIIYFPNGIVNI